MTPLARLVAFAALFAFAAFFAPAVARAQGGAPELNFRTDADVVGLGDTFRVTMQATSSGDMPTDPQLGASNGFAVVGMSPSTSTAMNFMNGVVSTERGLTNVWTLRATKLGTLTIGPPTVLVGGKRYRGRESLNVRVVPAGQAPPRPTQRPNGLDPFGGLFGQMPQIQFPGFDEPPQRRPEAPTTDGHLALDSARAPIAFLHATIDKPSAVVGEQVTYTALLYIDAQYDVSVINNALADAHEVPASDFVKRSLDPDDTRVASVSYADVGGKLYAVIPLRKLALFPLKTGDLDIGEMTLQLSVTGGGVRKTEDLHVHVTEPPVQGRPPGYAVGDVGQLALAAEVSGREVDQDGAIGVTVTLSGNGNLPASLDPPEHPGVEWLDPQVTEKVGPQKGDRFGGTRTFQYVVRLHRAGDVDLGDFSLAYWEPQNRIYQIARAPLGSVHVRAGATPSPKADEANDPLPALPSVRRTRETTSTERRHFDDAPAFWFGLGGMPLAYVAIVATAGTVTRARRRRAARGTSPEAELRARIRAAEEASAKGDSRDLDAATARAIEAATIAGRKLNVRGLATSDVARALCEAGTEEADAKEIESILRACDAARFSADTGGEAALANDRWQRARRAIDRLAGRPGQA